MSNNKILTIDNPANYQKEIDQARRFARTVLKSDFSAPICSSCSFGKDSLLCAVLLQEALEELNDKRKINLSFFYSGYEKESFQGWFKYCCNNIKKDTFSIKYITPSPFYHYSVKLLGAGRLPINPVYGRWCTEIKTDLIKILNDKINKDALEIVGVRAEESPKRRKDWQETGFHRLKGSKHTFRIIGGVSTGAVWWYLEKNLHKIGLEFDKLRAYYDKEERDGCWFCYAQKYEKADSIYADITLRLRAYNGGVANKNLDLRIRPEILRTNIYWCKKWFYELLELQEKWNKVLLSDLDKKCIFELWNIREKVDDVITQKKFLEAYFNGSYKMLYPELFDVVFQWNPRLKKHCYRYYVTKESGNNEQ